MKLPDFRVSGVPSTAWILLLILSTGQLVAFGSRSFSLHDVLDNYLLDRHGILKVTANVTSNLYFSTQQDHAFESSDEPHPFIVCSDENGIKIVEDQLCKYLCVDQQSFKKPNDSINDTPGNTASSSSSSSAIIYSNKKEKTTCFMVHFSPLEYSAARFTVTYFSSFTSPAPVISILPYHQHVKISPTVLDYLQGNLTSSKSFQKESYPNPPSSTMKEGNPVVKESFRLSIEFSPCSRSPGIGDSSFGKKHETSTWTALMERLSSLGESMTILRDRSASGHPQPSVWETIVSQVAIKSQQDVIMESNLDKSLTINLASCNFTTITAEAILSSFGVDIEHIERLSHVCLAGLVSAWIQSPHVIKLSVTPSPIIETFEAKGVLQGRGNIDVSPYTAMGLRGLGQVVGIADSGLNDLSCFFLDDPRQNVYETINTNRSGVVEPFRRKVVQYISYADELDYKGGHGTHVAASIVGDSLSGEFSLMNGVASSAKIAFFDIGLTESELLTVPALHTVFKSAHMANARVHSDSWGSFSMEYSSYAQDLDKFTNDHPEFLSVFAAGNNGAFGLYTVITPGNAKNVLTVGATQLRSVYNDELLTSDQSTIAYFSAHGPTSDGRIKPDILAPGDFIMSAFAGDPEVLRESLASNKVPSMDEDQHCAVHQMSGTSMATPLVAGIALLIRQYFMDKTFWAANCDPRYHWCKLGSFEPTGYLVKALILHSGKAVRRYSDPDHDDDTVIPAFNLDSSPPDFFQGYGQVSLQNLLPLKSKQGLNPELDLIVLDKFTMSSESTVGFNIDFDDYIASQLSRGQQSVALPAVKVTIAWYDPPSTVSTVRSLLLHDLDLLAVDANNRRYWGNLPTLSQEEEEEGEQQHYRNDSKPAAPAADDDDDWGSEPVYDLSDDKNTNEQVHFVPICDKTQAASASSSCRVKILVRCNRLFKSSHQDVGIVITTAGAVTGPFKSSWIATNVNDRSNSKGSSKASPPPPAAAAAVVGDIDHSQQAKLGRPITHPSPAMDAMDAAAIKNKSQPGDLSFQKIIALAPVALGARCFLPLPPPSIEYREVTNSSCSFFRHAKVVPDIVELETFSKSNVLLESLTMCLDSTQKEDEKEDEEEDNTNNKNNKLTGADAFLTAVIVTSSAGQAVQVGGYNYLRQENHFYRRMWPVTWISSTARPSTITGNKGSQCWLASRDVRAANVRSGVMGATGTTIEKDDWTVEISMGYIFGYRAPRNFSGYLVLSFQSISTSTGEQQRQPSVKNHDNHSNTSNDDDDDDDDDDESYGDSSRSESNSSGTSHHAAPDSAPSPSWLHDSIGFLEQPVGGFLFVLVLVIAAIAFYLAYQQSYIISTTADTIYVNPGTGNKNRFEEEKGEAYQETLSLLRVPPGRHTIDNDAMYGSINI